MIRICFGINLFCHMENSNHKTELTQTIWSLLKSSFMKVYTLFPDLQLASVFTCQLLGITQKSLLFFSEKFPMFYFPYFLLFQKIFSKYVLCNTCNITHLQRPFGIRLFVLGDVEKFHNFLFLIRGSLFRTNRKLFKIHDYGFKYSLLHVEFFILILKFLVRDNAFNNEFKFD